MTTSIKPLNKRPAWKALAAHHKQIQKLHLRKLFADDAKRGQKFSAEAAGLFLDYSKNRITDKTLKLLLQLAKESGLRAKIDAMFSGEKINITENRAVLHVALRAPKGAKHFCGRKKCRAGSPCRARQNGGLFQSRSQRRMERVHRQTHQEHRQHRHRRFRSRPGDGLRGAETLQRTQFDFPLRLQCGRH